MTTQLTKSTEIFLYFCRNHIFSAKLLMCTQTLIKLKHIQKLEILYEFVVRFHPKVRKSNLSRFTDCAKHASARALIHFQQTIYPWIFTQTKLSSIYRHKPIVAYWALMKRHALLTIYTKHRLANKLFFLVFLYFSVVKTLAKFPSKRVARGGNLCTKTLLYISKHIRLAFFCVLKKLLVVFICEV